MSMALITIRQLISIFLAYLCISVLVPHFVLGKTLRLRNRYEKFLIYTLFGNFYVINLVYFLEIFHISYRSTLILLTVIPCILIKIKLERIPVAAFLKEKWEIFRRLTGGQLGVKAYRESRKPLHRQWRDNIVNHLYDVYVTKFLDVLAIVILLVGLVYIYGQDLFNIYGYKASDVVVHNYWINSMMGNKIFVTGIYPYGFHNVVYYLRVFFGIDIMATLRLFSFVQAVWVHVELLCFLKIISKTRFLPYLGAYTYLFADFYRLNTYSRFTASLPQEFGMIFILPTAYALMSYFRFQQREERGDKTGKTKMILIAFCMGFSLTFTVHFYGVAIIGLYCVAIAIGFIKLFVKKKYFTRIMLTGIISVFVTLLPMIIAFAGGTRLQDSIYWGMSVIEGNPRENEDISLPQTDGEEEKDRLVEEYGAVVGTAVYGANSIKNNMGANIIENKYSNFGYLVIVFPFMLLLVGGIVYAFTKKRDQIYASVLLSGAVFTLLMVFMLNASLFHLPSVMDMNRGGIYYAYISTISVVLIADGIIYLITLWDKRKWVSNACSFVCVAAIVAYASTHGGIKSPVKSTPQEMNDAVECLTNIMIKDEPHMWTIVSANDERQMANDKGFHYESIDFLSNMENWTTYHKVTIPTPTVYFFVEKTPLAYNEIGYDSEEMISEKSANSILPNKMGIETYQGHNRLTVMSRLYYWCEAFMKLYPNEMTVFSESDNFICYRVEQNAYRLFNFAIDYDYNTRDYPETAADSDAANG